MAGKRRKKKKAGMIIFIIELIVLLVLVAGIFVLARINSGLRNIGSAAGTGGGNGSTGQGTAAAAGEGGVTHTDAAEDPNADADAAEENEGVSQNEHLKGYTNIALVGIDTRDTDQIDYANSDTMIIASINNDTGKIRMISLYRDTLLNIGNRPTSTSQGDDDDELDVFEEGGEEENEPSSSSSGSGSGSDSGSGSGSGSSSGSGSGEEEVPVEPTATEAPADDDWEEPTATAEPSYEEGSDDVTETPVIVYREDDEEESEYRDNEFYNYNEEGNDTSGISYQIADTTAEGRYDKANAAYANGSARQLLSMLNKNLDLNIHDYVVVDFAAVAKLVDDIDGIDVWMTFQEVTHMNNYCKETSKVTGLSYEPITPEEMPREYHLNGVQAVSYARIRYTAGNDMKRTQRQRVVIQKVVNKAKQRGIDTVNAMINDVFPMCKTSLSNSEIISLASRMFDYEIEKTSGFPFEHLEKNVYVGSKKLDAVVPVTLEDNVKELHKFLFNEKKYKCSSTVVEYSNDIAALSGLTEKSRDVAIKNSVIAQSGGEADVVK